MLMTQIPMVAYALSIAPQHTDLDKIPPSLALIFVHCLKELLEIPLEICVSRLAPTDILPSKTPTEDVFKLAQPTHGGTRSPRCAYSTLLLSAPLAHGLTIILTYAKKSARALQALMEKIPPRNASVPVLLPVLPTTLPECASMSALHL